MPYGAVCRWHPALPILEAKEWSRSSIKTLGAWGRAEGANTANERPEQLAEGREHQMNAILGSMPIAPPRTTYVVDSNRLPREGLIRLLHDTEFDVMGHARDIDGLLEDMNGQDAMPVFILVVLSGPLDSTRAKLQELRTHAPESKIVLLVENIDPRPMAQFFGAGVDGYLLKDISTQAFVGSLNLIQAGERVFPSQLIPLILRGVLDCQGPDQLRAATDANLSHREMQILAHLVEGSPNKIIANRLDVTEATVKVHVKSILRKTKARNRTQAAIWAMHNGLSHEGDGAAPPVRPAPFTASPGERRRGQPRRAADQVAGSPATCMVQTSMDVLPAPMKLMRLGKTPPS